MTRLSVLLVAVLFVCGDAAVIAADKPDEQHFVSFIRLMSRPEAYAQQEIVVGGSLSLRFEDVALYLDREARARAFAPDSIEISLSEAKLAEYRKLDGLDVVIAGTFLATDEERQYGPRGRLTSIRSIRAHMPLPSDKR